MLACEFSDLVGFTQSHHAWAADRQAHSPVTCQKLGREMGRFYYYIYTGLLYLRFAVTTRLVGRYFECRHFVCGVLCARAVQGVAGAV